MDTLKAILFIAIPACVGWGVGEFTQVQFYGWAAFIAGLILMSFIVANADDIKNLGNNQ